MVDGQTPPDAGAPADAGTTPPAAPPQAAAPEAPQEWPKKFLNEDGTENREGFLKGYHSLEHELATTKRVSAAQQPTSLAIPAQKSLADDASLDDIVRAAGLDPTEVVQQFRDRQERDGVGSLTPAFYKALKTQNMTKGLVDPHLNLLVKDYKAAQASLMSDASKLAGGDEQRNTVLAWAKDGVTKEDQDFFRSQSGDIRAFEWLLGKYKTAVGAGDARPLITGTGAPAVTGGYTSQAEWLKANNDPRYESDKVYRATVDARADKTDVKVIHGFV